MLWRTYLDSISARWTDLSAANNINDGATARAIIQIARGELPPDSFTHDPMIHDQIYRLAWWMYVRAPALDPRYLVLTRMNLDLVIENERTLSQIFDELEQLEDLETQNQNIARPENLKWLTPLRTMANPDFRMDEANYATLKNALDQALAFFIENGSLLREYSQQLTQDLLTSFDSEVRAGTLDVSKDSPDEADSKAQTVDELFQYANDLYNTADIESAEQAYSKVIERSPAHLDAYTQRGICRAALENLKDARLDFDHVLSEHDATHLSALLNRGLLHHSSGRYEDALKDYDLALKQVPDNVELLLNKAVVLASTGQFDQALDIFNRAAELEPQNAITFKHRAHLQRQRNEQESALSDYSRSIELDPRDAQVHAARGFLLFLMDRVDEAINDYEQAIALAPGDPTNYYNRGNAYSTLGQYENAIQDYTHAIALDSDDSDALINRGSAQMLAGNIVAAAEDWTQAIKLDPYHPTAYLKRATLWIATEQNDEAISDLGLALKYAPTNWPFVAEVEQLLEDLTSALDSTQENDAEDED